LLDSLLERLKAKGWLKNRGQQRTDSSHVLAAIRQINRLECVGEAIRRVLNDLATVVPEWLQQQLEPAWFERYSRRFESYRLPQKKAEREALQAQMGADGHQLLAAVYGATELRWLREMPSVEVMRRIWVQQYYVENGQVKWREPDNLPPNKLLIQSPYDPEARNRTKRQTNWTGYAVHLTETCDLDQPHLITNVETTPATTADIHLTDTIHTALADKDLLPAEHLVDTSYVEAEKLVNSRTAYQLELLGPVPPDNSWQARAKTGFSIGAFAVDWDQQQVTCPQGQTSCGWQLTQDNQDHPVIRVRFDRAACLACETRSQCTQAKTDPRILFLRPQAQHEALQAGRARQQTAAFKEKYNRRAGIEGTISQGVRAYGLRQARYIGLAKTHVQHLATAAAINLSRLASWLDGTPKAQTRVSAFAALAPGT
jgi:transposase